MQPLLLNTNLNHNNFHIWWLKENFDIKDILKLYLGYDPLISLSPNGKPYIRNNLKTPMFFNKSHSHGYLALAIAPFEIGIDLEKIKFRKNINRIAKRYFDDNEGLNLIDFYKSWTMREAYIKAKGGRLFDLMPKIKILPKSYWGESFIVNGFCLSISR